MTTSATGPTPVTGVGSVPLPHGVSRRAFLGFCSTMAAALALPVGEIARAVAAAPRLPVVWIATQDCTADTESLLRSVDPGISALLLDVISLDYHETLMAPAGARAGQALDAALDRGGYVCVVEGAIPTASNGVHCLIDGETGLSLVRRATAGALFTLAVGSCAVDGGIAAAAPNPTGATGVSGAVSGIANLVNLPGCPVNGVNLVATIVYYLTHTTLPPLDSSRRPTFAYGQRIHAAGACDRYEFFRAGQYVLAWGDEGHRKGWCLRRMGCAGPRTFANCHTRNWNETSWPIGAGHPCVGCTVSRFWDGNTPFYVRKPGN
ncbi:MAG: hydrogenase small subunit [Actinomycetales bacterium]|nr:hydrogenase small subunit [Actinomycetales bacterium]